MSANHTVTRILREATKLLKNRSPLQPATSGTSSGLLSSLASVQRELAAPGRWRGLSQTVQEQTLPASISGQQASQDLADERSPDSNTGPQEPRKKFELVAAFTCNKCGTRSVRAFSKVAYERGVVLARCGGCQVQHLLADRLGWFGKEGTIEDFLRERGESIRSYKDGTMELSEEDLLGWSKGS